MLYSEYRILNRGYNYTTLSKEERREYHRDKMREIRENRALHYLEFKRGMLGRYVDENKIFNKKDLEYINSINK